MSDISNEKKKFTDTDMHVCKCTISNEKTRFTRTKFFFEKNSKSVSARAYDISIGLSIAFFE